MSSLVRGNYEDLKDRLTAQRFWPEARLQHGSVKASVFWRFNGDIAVIVEGDTPDAAILVTVSGAETECFTALSMPAMLEDV